MRAKTSKANRRLMQQHQQLGFRPPYQVLVDAETVQEAERCKINLPRYLRNTLQDDVKIFITQCCMRHLYNQDPNSPVIDVAKTFERRRCGHHPNEYPEPLSTRNCLSSIVGPTNKYRYIVASQDTAVRRAFRNVPAVPLIYIRRSVMILEPMSSATASVRDDQERSKFRAGLKSRRAAILTSPSANVDAQDAPVKKKPKARGAKGPKGPNPLSVKKAKKTE